MGYEPLRLPLNQEGGPNGLSIGGTPVDLKAERQHCIPMKDNLYLVVHTQLVNNSLVSTIYSQTRLSNHLGSVIRLRVVHCHTD